MGLLSGPIKDKPLRALLGDMRNAQPVIIKADSDDFIGLETAQAQGLLDYQCLVFNRLWLSLDQVCDEKSNIDI